VAEEVAKHVLRRAASGKASDNIRRFIKSLEAYVHDNSSIVEANMAAGGNMGLGIAMFKGGAFCLRLLVTVFGSSL
jgi:hypothetical protein